MTISRWESLVPLLPDAGTFEVVLHPGIDDPDARTRYPWGYEWEEEARALESEELAALFTSRGVETESFSRLAAG
jgi:hypothetical protein